MNMFKQMLFLVVFFVGLSGHIFAQDLSLDGVMQARMKNMNAIIEGEDVVGYYMFYEVDKKDRKTRNYLLQLFDQNLNKTTSKRILGTQYLNLIDARYNGETIMLKFIDAREKIYLYKQYDKNAELVYTKERAIEPLEYNLLAEGTDVSFGAGAMDIIEIPNSGFANISTKKNKKLGYHIEFFPKSKGTKGWKYTSSPKSKLIEVATHLGGNEEIYVANVLKRPNGFSQQITSVVLGLDTKTGEKLYEIDLSDEKYRIFAFSCFLEQAKKQSVLFGYYFDKTAAKKNKSKGICAVTVDNTSGEIISRKFVSWSEDVAKYLDVNNKGKVKGEGYTHFHKFIKTSNGKIYGIGEQFRQSASAAGIALTAVGVGGNVTKLVIEDLVLYEFSENFELTGTKFVEKGKTEALAGNLLNVQMGGFYINSIGLFDYMFVQKNIKEDIFTVFYTQREKKSKGWQVRTLTQVDNSY
ncbi:MAG: DUF6770 family protein, partial [Bacteroidota bacterium]